MDCRDQGQGSVIPSLYCSCYLYGFVSIPLVKYGSCIVAKKDLSVFAVINKCVIVHATSLLNHFLKKMGGDVARMRVPAKTKLENSEAFLPDK